MKVIPTRIAEELHRGSYENVIQQVEEAVSESHSLFGAAVPSSVELVATFSGKAIVMNESGGFYRISYEPADGGVVISESEEIDVPVLETRHEKRGYLKEAAGEAVAALFSGDTMLARDRVREIVRSSEYAAPATPIEELRERIGGVLTDDREWRRFFADHGNSLRRYTWGASGAIARYAPKPKYQHLYREDDADLHADAVTGDLEFMLEKLGSLWEQFSEAWPKYKARQGGFSGLELAGISERFDSFATDYADELKAVCRLAEQASKDRSGDNTLARALIYDALAKRYSDLAVAAQFVSKVSVELA